MNANDAKQLVTEAGTNPVNLEVRSYIETQIRQAARKGSKIAIVKVLRTHNEQVVCEGLRKDGFTVSVSRHHDCTDGLCGMITEYQISW